MFPLRQYQSEASHAVKSAWLKGIRTNLLVMPTGTGKTRVIADVVDWAACRDEHTWVIAHRGELLTQAADKILRDAGIFCAVEKAEQSAAGCLEKCVVASIDTLLNPERTDRLRKPDRIIIDEAHHATAQKYRGVLARYPDVPLLGVTATPDRNDQVNLGVVFQNLAYEYTLPRAIEEGFLCPIEAQTIPLKIDMTGVGSGDGDYVVKDLGEHLEPYMERIVLAIKEKAQGRKTLVFAPLRQTARRGRDLALKHGLRSAYVGGDSEDRAEVLANMEKGEYDILWNAMLLTEGYDCPSIDCVVVLRLTQSRSLYSQMCGRGTRIHPGKKNLLLLDFLWMTSRHSPCHPPCLLADCEDVAESMKKIMDSTGRTDVTLDLMEAAKRDVEHERELNLAKQLKEMSKRKGNLLDPLAFAAMTGHRELLSYTPGLNDSPPSMAQLEAIKKRGIYAGDIRTQMEANTVLSVLGARESSGMAPPSHISMLGKLRFKNPEQLTKKQSDVITRRIFANGFHVPHEYNKMRFDKE